MSRKAQEKCFRKYIPETTLEELTGEAGLSPFYSAAFHVQKEPLNVERFTDEQGRQVTRCNEPLTDRIGQIFSGLYAELGKYGVMAPLSDMIVSAINEGIENFYQHCPEERHVDFYYAAQQRALIAVFQLSHELLQDPDIFKAYQNLLIRADNIGDKARLAKLVESTPGTAGLPVGTCMSYNVLEVQNLGFVYIEGEPNFFLKIDLEKYLNPIDAS